MEKNILEIKLAKNEETGAAPNATSKYRAIARFLEHIIYYQYTQGHSVVESLVADPGAPVDKPKRVNVVCDTPCVAISALKLREETLPDDVPKFPPSLRGLSSECRNCPFSISVNKEPGEDPKTHQKIDVFIIDQLTFRPQHSHAPYYYPLDINVENARRAALLQHNPNLRKDSAEVKAILTPLPKAVSVPNGVSNGTVPAAIIPKSVANAVDPESFKAILNSIDPYLNRYESDLKHIGLLDIPPLELWTLGSEEVWKMIMAATSMSLLERTQIFEGYKRAMERRTKGDMGPLDGSLGLSEATLRATRTWIAEAIAKGERGLQEQRQQQAARV